MGQFVKGESGNPAGRPKGTPNKVTSALRETIANFLNAQFEQIEKDFSQLKPFARVKLYIELLQFGIPKLNAVQVQDDLDKLNDEQVNQIMEELKARAEEIKNHTDNGPETEN